MRAVRVIRLLKLSNYEPDKYLDGWPFRIHIFCLFFTNCNLVLCMEIVGLHGCQPPPPHQDRWPTIDNLCWQWNAEYWSSPCQLLIPTPPWINIGKIDPKIIIIKDLRSQICGQLSFSKTQLISKIYLIFLPVIAKLKKTKCMGPKWLPIQLLPGSGFLKFSNLTFHPHCLHFWVKLVLCKC